LNTKLVFKPFHSLWSITNDVPENVIFAFNEEVKMDGWLEG